MRWFYISKEKKPAASDYKGIFVIFANITAVIITAVILREKTACL
jgi:hypothetical protein